MGGPFPESENCRLAKGARIEVRANHEVLVSARLAGFELLHNCWSPHQPRNMAILIDSADFELPKDAEVWAEEATKPSPVTA